MSEHAHDMGALYHETQREGHILRFQHGVWQTMPLGSGTGTIADGQSSVTVAYPGANTAGAITITPRLDATLWVSARTSTGFTVSRTGTSGAAAFDWMAL